MHNTKLLYNCEKEKRVIFKKKINKIKKSISLAENSKLLLVTKIDTLRLSIPIQ